MEYAPTVLTELADPFDLIMDIMDFANLSKNSLKDITLTVVDFKVSFSTRCASFVHIASLHILTVFLLPWTQLCRNRNLTLIYMDLLVVYIRVMKMFELIEDRLTIVSLYTAAYNLKPDVDRSFSSTRTNR